MRSSLPKALHRVGGLTLIEHVIRATASAGLPRPWVVTGYQAERVEEALEGQVQFFRQPEPLGTGDAVATALAGLADTADDVLVLIGDCPLVPPELLEELVARHEKRRPAATIVTTTMNNPSGYGRIVRGADGRLAAIVEDRDATADIRRITEINTGIGIWRVRELKALLDALPWHGTERYLTDAVQMLIDRGETVETLEEPDAMRVMGINTRKDLAEAETKLREITLDRLFEQGVTIIDPASTFVDAGVEIGQDTILYPMTFVQGKTKIGRDCHIGPMARVVSSRIGDGVVVDRSVVEQSVLASKVTIGPFSHLRAGTYLDRDVHIGNFVEVKNTRVGIGTKAGHHAYLGDATIGGRVNIGAGTVIVNYDGITKNPTFIGDEAFIGCNANLVAPVEIGAGAYVAAGSTVTQNVPADALAIARARQENKPDWAAGKRKHKGGDRAH